MEREQAWLEARRYGEEDLALAEAILKDVRAGCSVAKAVRRHPRSGGGYIPKHTLIHAYRQLTESGRWPFEQEIMERLRMKPTRTLSGVATVSILTQPFPCPGTCVFCPTDVRLPKSYLPDEPGAMRALHHAFDPSQQTASRLQALEAIGHPIDKIEVLVLGGTWSAYPREYQRCFIQRCLDALNGFDSQTLEEAQKANEGARHRNVGLVIETRPDAIDPEEIAHLRALGVTKVQMGYQSLDDEILRLNRRGHTVEDTRRAMGLLRRAGFKVVAHWMPNLLGSTPERDRADFLRLWEDPALRPDELKIYPCQLLENAELYEFWRRGEYEPYSTETLIALLADLKVHIPRYCRVNRVVRDIPSGNVVAGNKRTSLRQDIRREMARRGQACACIRCREIRDVSLEARELSEEILAYEVAGGEEHFLSFATEDDRLAGYLRLSLPADLGAPDGFPELSQAALVRELHIYGPSLEVGAESEEAAQHRGLGRELMAMAEERARQAGYRRVAVIAALGTRGYYRRLGYRLEGTYMVKDLEPETGPTQRVFRRPGSHSPSSPYG